MKKSLFILGGVILMITLAIPQQLNAQVKFGPAAGVNFSDVTGDVNSDGLLIGFHFGGLVNFGITDYFMVEPQIFYSMRGAKGDGADLETNYLEIPVWLRYQLESGLNFNAGVYSGILLSAKVGDNDVKDSYKGLDFGLGGGIGYQMRSGLGFTASYTQGLSNILDDDRFSATNTCIKLTLSYTIGGKRE